MLMYVMFYAFMIDLMLMLIPELLAQMSTLEERLNSTVSDLEQVKRDNAGIITLCSLMKCFICFKLNASLD